METSPFSSVVQQMHEISPISSWQVTIDDNKLIRDMSQNRQCVFGLGYPVHNPTFLPKLTKCGSIRVAS